MSLPVQIKANQAGVNCKAGQTCECAFDVTNVSDAELRIGLDTVHTPAEDTWTKVLEPDEFKLPPRAMDKVVVRVSVPKEAASGQRSFSLRAYDTQALENFAISAPVALTVPPPDKVVVDEQKDERKIVPPNPNKWKLIALIAGGAVALIGAFAWLFWPKGEVVPSVINVNVPAATQLLNAAGFKLGTVTLIEAEEGSPGNVINQMPDAGERAAPETPVDLTVVKHFVFVPQLRGLPRDRAIAQLTQIGLSEGKTSTQLVQDKVALTVLDQAPDADVRVETGTPVDLVVQDTSIVVPPVVSLSVEQARTALVNAGLTVEPTKIVRSKTGPFGTIASQDPPANRQVPPGTKATLTVRVPAHNRFRDIAGLEFVRELAPSQ
jgi:beta-lactam-binding protein with PASTA domain